MYNAHAGSCIFSLQALSTRDHSLRPIHCTSLIALLTIPLCKSAAFHRQHIAPGIHSSQWSAYMSWKVAWHKICVAVFDICHVRLPGIKCVAVFDICHKRLPGMKCVAVFDMWWKVTWHETHGSVWHVMKGYLAWTMWHHLTYMMKGYLAWTMWQCLT